MISLKDDIESEWTNQKLGSLPEMLYDCGEKPGLYNEKRKVFNRRFDFRPSIIVFPTTAKEVSFFVNYAKARLIEIRVRGGGHDHEGESVATDAIVLDMSKINYADVDKDQGVVRLGPGGIFMNLITVLNAAKVGIPHGTCQTVGITGFTLGGGWGPWTRMYGMCCESLVGATIVLGNGDIKELTEDCPDRELLWALRGGGGFSYGIVTELVIKTFPLPEVSNKFEVSWTTTPGIEVLRAWEEVIGYDSNEKLIGTNLKMVAKPEDKESVDESIHYCYFYGYYEGDEEEIRATVAEWFTTVPDYEFKIVEETDDRPHLQFSTWDRLPARKLTATKANLLGAFRDIPLEGDKPAPHKITSRLVNETGWDEEGRRNLIRSLRSNLLSREGEDEHGVMAYVTLGAISGKFYRDYSQEEGELGSAFPYKKRPFTIQYQTWWETNGPTTAEAAVKNGVNLYTNRAMDWIQTCRQMSFPQTSGAFISFKDAGIPTETYFMQNYKELIRIKKDYSEDKLNRFRSRKTIL